MMRPLSMATTRLPKRLTSSRSWVTTRMVVPMSLIFSSSDMISKDRAGSRLPVGSSAMMTLGLLARARAMATRCCSPPESWVGSWRLLPVRPTRPRTYGIRRRISLVVAPTARMATSMFSKTVFFSISRKSWKTTPMVRRRSGICFSLMSLRLYPFTMSLPLVGAISAVMSLMMVDLPEPDGPTRKTKSPSSICMLTPFRALVPLGYSL